MTNQFDQVNKDDFKKSVESYCRVLCRKSIDNASRQQQYQAVAYAVKDIVVDHWMETHRRFVDQDAKIVYYLSMEFLMGRSLLKNAFNLGVSEILSRALEELGFHAADVFEAEPDAALGNGDRKSVV